MGSGSIPEPARDRLSSARRPLIRKAGRAKIAPAAMAQDEDPLDHNTAAGAALFGGIGSVLIWLTIGADAVAKYAWVAFGAALMLGMKYLPAPAAQPLITVCRGVGSGVWVLVAGLFMLAPGALA